MRVGKPIGNRDVNAGLTVGPSGPGVNANVNVGSVHGSVNAGIGGVQPRIQIGDSTAAGLGATAGQIGGNIVAGPIGGAVGSAAVSGQVAAIEKGVNMIGNPFGGNKEVQRQGKNRRSTRNSLFGDTPQITLADGSMWDFNSSEGEGLHDWKDPSWGSRQGPLRKYDADFTNDLDYISAMGGISLARMLNGKSDTATDQVGSEMGNAFLGKVGYKGQFNQETFNHVVTNMRSVYAQKGINSKEEMLSLASTMNSQGRLSDPEYAVMKQTAGMVFDSDFNLATQLMSGRGKGLNAASKTGKESSSTSTTPQEGVNRPGRIYSPTLSPEEAFLSVQPLIDRYQQLAGKNPRGASSTAATIAQGAGLISAIAGAGSAINKLTGGALSQGIRDIMGLGNSDPGIDATTIGNVGSNSFDLPDFSTNTGAIGAAQNSDVFNLPGFDLGLGGGAKEIGGSIAGDIADSTNFDLGSGGLDFSNF